MSYFNYSIIPSFDLYDNCYVDSYMGQEAFIKTKMTFSLLPDGRIKQEEYRENGEREKYFIRRFTTKFVAENELYGQMYFIRHFISQDNLETYESIRFHKAKWEQNLEGIRTSEADNIRSYFVLVKESFEQWFETNAIELTDENFLFSINTPDGRQKIWNKILTNQDKTKQISLSIELAASYVNSKLRQLPTNYKVKNVAELVGDAWNNIVPLKLKAHLKAKEFSRILFPYIHHRFNDWKFEAFYKSFNLYLPSPNNPKKV